MNTILITERMKSEFHGLVIYVQRLACVPVNYEIQLPNATVIQAKTILEDTFDTSNVLVGRFFEIESLLQFIEFNDITLIDLLLFDKHSNRCLAQLIEYEGEAYFRPLNWSNCKIDPKAVSISNMSEAPEEMYALADKKMRGTVTTLDTPSYDFWKLLKISNASDLLVPCPSCESLEVSDSQRSGLANIRYVWLTRTAGEEFDSFTCLKDMRDLEDNQTLLAANCGSLICLDETFTLTRWFYRRTTEDAWEEYCSFQGSVTSPGF